jgi:hypothetical protein
MVALFLFFKEMTGALAPFSYLVIHIHSQMTKMLHPFGGIFIKRIGEIGGKLINLFSVA